MGLVTDLGTHVEKMRELTHGMYVEANQRGLRGNQTVALANVKRQCDILQPGVVFLTGGNALQTQSTAALNGGCGLISISEIKSGKCRYTNPDGTYGTFLKFYDPNLGGHSFRQAEEIPRIENYAVLMGEN